MSLEGEQIFFSAQSLGDEQHARQPELSKDEALHKFKLFIKEFQEENVFTYRDNLIANSQTGKYFLNLDYDDLNSFDEGRLASLLKAHPNQFIPIFEQGLKEIYISLQMQSTEAAEDLPDFQLQISSDEDPKMLRNLNSNQIGELIIVPGIITSASKPEVKACMLRVQCSNCGNVKSIPLTKGLGGALIPRMCDNASIVTQNKEKCPLDSYVIMPQKSDFINQQTFKLQENPELIPTGEMPRSFLLTCDRYLVDKMTPGMRVKVIGVFCLLNRKSKEKGDRPLNISYIRAIGIHTEEALRYQSVLSQEDQNHIIGLAKQKDIHQKIFKSIGSSIYGSDNIKQALACLLFGGSPKVLPDKTKLRADINVLLLGDPSTAKSQFLKFVERVAPISVYTSGKGSSAAGLTASVNRDATSGEFELEGGAMVLGDGGVVCIDEFDKMRTQDRVAIHEAMEQQTISIAKAGITTILNSRCSVLAAANPIFGTYDDLRQASEQIDFQTTILSRFDCIFIVKDVRDKELDRKIADHVIGLHMGGHEVEERKEEISLKDLKKYITYARSKFFPRLSDEAGVTLENFYVNDRQEVAQNMIRQGGEKTGIPITVRQLEAIIRLSESLAKMELSNIVKKKHVEEAHRLFRVSTMEAAKGGSEKDALKQPEELKEVIIQIEDGIKRRMAVGTKMSYEKLITDMLSRCSNKNAINHAVLNMIRRDELSYSEGRKVIMRKK